MIESALSEQRGPIKVSALFIEFQSSKCPFIVQQKSKGVRSKLLQSQGQLYIKLKKVDVALVDRRMPKIACQSGTNR